MTFILKMPKLSPTMDIGTIALWHKSVGDFVEEGDHLMDVITDKATVEYSSAVKGWLRKIIVEENEEASVEQPIAIFSDERNEDISSCLAENASGLNEESIDGDSARDSSDGSLPIEEKKTPISTVSEVKFKPYPPLKSIEFPYNRCNDYNDDILATPLAKSIAKEEGLNLRSVKGSGHNGKIMSKDLQFAQKDGLVSFNKMPFPKDVGGSYEEESLSVMRKAISKRMQDAKSFVPHFYVSQTVDMGKLVSIREDLKSMKVSVSINDMIVRACAIALTQHRQINSGFDSEQQKIIHFKTIDISIAVSVEGGLMTPIIRYADCKNLGQISTEIKILSQKAKDNKLKPEEYLGGSFTISNLGMFNVKSFEAILNTPQSAILAVGGIKDVPMVDGEKVVCGKETTITISADHRVLDGVVVSKFLNTVKQLLEKPAILLLN